MARVPYRAIVFTAFSLYLAATAPFFTLQWFAFVGLVLVSFARFHKIQHGVPCPELLYLGTALVTSKCAAWILGGHIPAWDEILWKFDANFGYPEVWVARLDQRSEFLNMVLSAVYQGLPLAGVLTYLAMPNSTPIRRKYCIASALGGTAIFFYRICPAAGPHYLFGARFPDAVPPLLHPQPRFLPGTLLNCAPSGHAAWAMILVWFAWRYCGRGWRIATGVYLGLTCAATLVAEHYWIDLIVAVPFAVALVGAAEKRWNEAAGGSVLLAAWLVALRCQWALAWPPPLDWALAAATLALPWWIGRVGSHSWPFGNLGAAAPTETSSATNSAMARHVPIITYSQEDPDVGQPILAVPRGHPPLSSGSSRLKAVPRGDPGQDCPPQVD